MINSLKLGMTCTLALALGQTAWAHAHLEQANPAPDSTVSEAPGSVEIAFSEPIEAAFSGAELRTGGKSLPASRASVSAADPKRLVVPVATPLGSGRYEVRWHVLSTDGHKTQGAYTFTVK